MSAPLLLKRSLLDQAPSVFAEGPVQARFDAVHETLVRAARLRLSQLLTISLEPAENREPDSFEFGALSAFDQAAFDPLAAMRRSVEAAARSSASQAWYASPDQLLTLDDDSAIDNHSDSWSSGAIFRQLDSGWQLAVQQPHSIEGAIRHLMNDLAIAYGGIAPTLFYGMRSALGAPCPAITHPRFIVQLAGRRSVQGESVDQPLFQMAAGNVLLAPAGVALTHLPLDEDSMHLEIVLSRYESSTVDRSALAMAVASCSNDYALARSVVAADPAAGWPFRLLAPGGLQVLAIHDDGAVDVAVAQNRLTLTHVGVEILAQLVNGEQQTALELAGRLADEAVDVAAIAAFCEELWEIGLLDPAPGVDETLRSGARLTQVGSATGGGPALAAIADLATEADWRVPRAGEVHHNEQVIVHVQPLHLDANRAAEELMRVVYGMAVELNRQFFGLDVIGPASDDPALIVRVKPGPPDVAVGDAVRQLGSDLAPPFDRRKLTFVVSLSAGARPSLLVPDEPHVAKGADGDLMVWPSFRPWIVDTTAPIDQLFLVGRLHGPAFR